MVEEDRLSEVLSRHKPVLVAAHQRSGTHLTIDLLRRQFSETWIDVNIFASAEKLYLNLDRLRKDKRPRLDIETTINRLESTKRPLVKTHSFPNLTGFGEWKKFAKKILDRSDILYVMRDGRDVMSSFYAYRGYEGDMADFLRKESIFEAGYSILDRWVQHVTLWMKYPGVKILRFENLLNNTGEVINMLSKILALEPLYEKPLLPVKKGNWGVLSEITQRLFWNRQSTAVNGRSYGREPPDWKDDVSDQAKEIFYENAGDILKSFNYV